MSRPSAASPHVSIVGGGPAGAAAAILLARRGVRVTVARRAESSAPRGGEALPPSIAPLLAELGVLEEIAGGPHLPSYGNDSAWGGDRLRMRSFMTSPHGT